MIAQNFMPIRKFVVYLAEYPAEYPAEYFVEYPFEYLDHIPNLLKY